MIDEAKSSVDDIPTASWVDRFAPKAAKPYTQLARIDRPIGTWLLLLPCWWGLALASATWPAPEFLALFAIGAMVMRGAGCTLNDIADREFDARVARTASRPIPSGKVSVTQAFAFMAVLSLIGLIVLLQFNSFAIFLGMASLALVAVYPFMKRITYWPQAVLGLAFNWGALMGWAVVHAELALPAVILYAAGLFWTLGYDTIYAHQDKEDDLLVGIKSTALRLGDATRPWLAFFYAITVVLLAIAGYLVKLAWPFYLVLGLAALHLVWQIAAVAIDDPRDCLSKFKANRDFGFIVFAAIVIGRVAA